MEIDLILYDQSFDCNAIRNNKTHYFGILQYTQLEEMKYYRQLMQLLLLGEILSGNFPILIVDVHVI